MHNKKIKYRSATPVEVKPYEGKILDLKIKVFPNIMKILKSPDSQIIAIDSKKKLPPKPKPKMNICSSKKSL